MTFICQAYIFSPQILNLFRGSSMVEHAAVNRRVAGSSPARGAKKPQANLGLFCLCSQCMLFILSSSIKFTLDKLLTSREDCPSIIMPRFLFTLKSSFPGKLFIPKIIIPVQKLWFAKSNSNPAEAELLSGISLNKNFKINLLAGSIRQLTDCSRS